MKKQPLILLAIFLFASILIFLNNGFPGVKFFSNITQTVFSPPKSLLYDLRVFISREDAPELKKIKEENAKLSEKLIEFQRLKGDNEALTSQFETSETKEFNLLPAHVIGFLGRFSSPASLIIDRGEKHGIKAGMAVIFKNNLVGKIIQVSPSYSQVILPLNEKFSVIGKTTEGDIPGVIKGEEDFILLDRVHVNEKITLGELILTKGEINEKGFGVPPDFIIGRVISVNKNESLPFQTAKVEALIPFSKLNQVFILLSV